MSLLDQSAVTGGGLDPCNVLFVNMDNMWTERFVNYDCLVTSLHQVAFQSFSVALQKFDFPPPPDCLHYNYVIKTIKPFSPQLILKRNRNGINALYVIHLQ